MNSHTSHYALIVDPKYRIGKHILLILVLAVISFNQIFYLFSKDLATVGNYIYLLGSITLFFYLVLAYSNIYILVPKLLLKKHYITYGILLFLSVALIILMRSVAEYEVKKTLGLFPEWRTYTRPFVLLNNLSYCAITAMCIFGTSISLLLKYFMTESQYVAQLEREQLRSEVIQLKEQIAPDFLSKILNYTSVIVKTDAKKASAMLMKLSQLLRYQLYDCNRDKVLLNSTIKFINNYLTIMQWYNNKICYKTSVKENINPFLISPLLLFPFVRYAVGRITNQNNTVEICLLFEVEDLASESMLFTCSLSDEKISFDSKDFLSIRQRLDHLYEDGYKLIVNKRKIQLRLNSMKL